MEQPVRWGILGAAQIARRIVRAIGQSRSSVVGAVASRNLERAVEFAGEHGIPRAFGSYEELLNSRDVDAVYVPLPNSLHAEWTMRALEAGKPVLCEKPFAVSAAQAREMAAVSRRTGLLLAEAFMYRFHPMYETVSGLIESGAIGRIIAIDSAFTFFLEDRGEIPASFELAGGSLMDVGCYCVNLSRMIAKAEPSRAFAFERRTTVDDTMVGALEFANGPLAHFECSIEASERLRVEIVGTGGEIVLGNAWIPGEADAEVLVRRGGEEQRIVVPGANAYRLEVEDFVRALRTGQPLRWPPEDAIANMAVIDALYESARTGKSVEVKREV
jgi:predicted dehydrogenase